MTIPNWEGKTILIVEDDEISMEFLLELLHPTNANLIQANNGELAIQQCANNKNINLVLMDVRLPQKTGKEAMIEIKKDQPNLPIIAQTAFAMSGDKEKYIELGFDNYVSKPIIMDELFLIISKYL